MAGGASFDGAIAFATRVGPALSTDGGASFAHASNATFSENLLPCAGQGSCYLDIGKPRPLDAAGGGGATAFASPSRTQWTASGGELVATTLQENVSFVGLPWPTVPGHFTGDTGLRSRQRLKTSRGAKLLRAGFGGSAAVVLDDGTYLQTAIVSGRLANDTDATSIVLFSSTDGASFSYFSTVAAAVDNPSSDEGPNEHAMEVLADGSLLVVFRVDCGDGTHGGAFKPYVQTRSTDGGRTWSATADVPGAPGCAYPSLLRLASGPLLLSGGRSMFAGTFAARSFSKTGRGDAAAATWIFGGDIVARLRYRRQRRMDQLGGRRVFVGAPRALGAAQRAGAAGHADV